MTNENPFMALLDQNSDDEIFEIISNPSETDNPSKYTAAISIALKREMISEYQAENLLDGNTTVLDYNPSIIDKQVDDFMQEKAIYKKESRNKFSNIQYGLWLIGAGNLLILLALSGDLWFPIKTKTIGISSIVVGAFLLLIGFIEKRKKKMKEKLQV